MASKFVEEIGKMSVMDLVTLVKELEDEFGVSAAAPMMAAPAAAAGAAPAEAAAEQSEYKITLKDVGAEKIKVIKALRSAIPSLSLKDAKEKVESAPCVVAEAVSKDDAKKIEDALKEAGATIEKS